MLFANVCNKLYISPITQHNKNYVIKLKLFTIASLNSNCTLDYNQKQVKSGSESEQYGKQPPCSIAGLGNAILHTQRVAADRVTVTQCTQINEVLFAI